MSYKKFLLSMTLAPAVYAKPLTRDTFELMTRPIVFSRAGLELFFMEQFNMPTYTEHVLPAHFGHLAHFLHYSNTLTESHDFVITIFEIFHTRMKDTRWVNALSFGLLLEQLPRYLQDLCTPQEPEPERLQEAIRDILYKRLITRMAQLSDLEKIGEVIDPTVQEITALIKDSAKKNQAQELQNLVTRFIESALEKVVWNPYTQQDSWNSVCLLAEQIEELYRCGIITSAKTVSQLHWSLLYRYGYFLSASHDVLKPELFTYINEDLASREHEWLARPEVEGFLRTKKDYIKNCLWEQFASKEIGI